MQDYVDDESISDESSQVGSLTKEKWENLGTREAVEKSRSQMAHRTLQPMAGKFIEYLFQSLSDVPLPNNNYKGKRQ